MEFCECEYMCSQNLGESIGTLALELQIFVSCLMRVLGQNSVNILNCSSISPAPTNAWVFFFKLIGVIE